MTSPYIRLTKAAIEAKLKQNEGLIFHALMMQTLGYRKTVDNLTDKRLAQLTGIRLDHFRPALDRFLNYGLFYRIEHRDYDYQYRICEEYLDDPNSTIAYPPSLPKSGETRESRGNLPELGGDIAQTSGNLTELGGHTTENLNIKKPPQPKTDNNNEKNNFTKKQPPQKKSITETNFMEQQIAVTTISMQGLEKMPEHFVIESSGSVRFEFSASSQEIAVKTPATITEPVCVKQRKSISESIVEPVKFIEQVEQPIVEKATQPLTYPVKNHPATTAKTVSTLAESIKPIPKNTANTTEKTVVVVDDKKSQHKPLALPKVIGEVNINACNNHFQALSYQQQKDVLTVFYHMLKVSTIRNKANYFIRLITSAKEGALTGVIKGVGNTSFMQHVNFSNNSPTPHSL